MPEIIPVKTEKKGELKQFRTGDFVPVKHGGTGTTNFNPRKHVRNIAGQVVGNSTDSLQLLKCVYDGDRDPTSNDSIQFGFSIGSRWVNIEEDNEWVCVDAGNKEGNAVWIQTGTGDSPFGDTFRYYGSLVDFIYDYQEYTWDDVNNNRKNEVIQIDYYNGGLAGTYVAKMTISYNVENQPIKLTMNYLSPLRSTKTLDFAYDNDGYFDTMNRT